MTPQIVIMSVDGRKEISASCFERFWRNGGMKNYTPTIRYASDDLSYPPIPLALVNASIVLRQRHKVRKKSEFEDFKTMLLECDPTQDLVFLEDDLAPCHNAIHRMVNEPVPDGCGLLSFFDFRNEWKTAGVFTAPPRDLWGSQAVKFSAAMLPHLVADIQKTKNKLPGDKTPEGLFYTGWDTWSGSRVQAHGFKVMHFSPSLVQHLGTEGNSVVDPNGSRPVAHNFPGEDWNAMRNWPAGVPIVEGPCRFIVGPPRICQLHGLQHPRNQLCPPLAL